METCSFTFSGKAIWAPVRLKSVIRPLTVWFNKCRLTGRSTVILGALLIIVPLIVVNPLEGIIAQLI
jgi:hypothetical protein